MYGSEIGPVVKMRPHNTAAGLKIQRSERSCAAASCAGFTSRAVELSPIWFSIELFGVS